MERIACADLPAFPLQILLHRHPTWRGLPAAVADEDRPQGRLLWVNEHARKERVLPGMRYASALGLARDLRAGVIAPTEIESSLDVLATRLRFFSPEVEASRAEPGTFWLGAGGLGLLHPEFQAWAGLIRSDLRQAGYDGRVAVGFTRFGCYAAARATAEVVVFGSPEEEHAAVRRIPVDRIATDLDFRNTLARLGIHDLGGFLDLPPSGIRRRFGESALALHRLARGDSWTPLRPEIPEDPHERRIVLDHPETDSARLLNRIDDDLRILLQRLTEEGRALRGLAVELVFDRPDAGGSPARVESIRPSTPTCEFALVRGLLRLRLDSRPLPSGIVEIRLEADFAEASPSQLGLFPEFPRRDPAAADRALARVRAEFGDQAVGFARPVEAHLPEARFTIAPLLQIAPARPRPVRVPPVARRLLWRSEPLAGPASGGPPTGMALPGLGKVSSVSGPFVISGGWWRRGAVRHYWYARVEPSATAAGSGPGDEVWIWLYYDARRRRWYRQGGVE